MKAVGYYDSTSVLAQNSLMDIEVPTPELRPDDLLVEIKAVSVNPVDYKIRQGRSSAGKEPVILGWDASGIVRQVGAKTMGFKVGDAVYYAGDIARPGSNAELQAVDYRLVAQKPTSLKFEDAAALPLTSLTAFEALFEKLKIPFEGLNHVLIIGGAGGVGSIAVQLLKQLTQAKVYATYGRPESRAWLEKLGVSGFVDRKQPLSEGLKKLNIPSFDFVFSTTHSDQYLSQIPEVMTPFGGFCLIDDPESLDVVKFKRKSLSIHWELMFTKSLTNHHMETQGNILNKVAGWVDGGKIKPTSNRVLKGLTAENVMEAHRQLESMSTIGKIVIAV